MLLRALALLSFLTFSLVAQAETIRMAVTTSFENSGLADVLLPAVENELGIEVQLLVVGTGQALRLGEAGDVDAVLVHSRPAEEAFVADGHGTHRREIMYNDFIIVGPSSDPAEVSDASSAADAFARVAATGADIVSRGDDSGTHKKELAIWNEAGIDPQTLEPSYRAVGAGMGAALNTASGLNAYVLSDRPTWINFGNKGDLTLLYSGDPILFNPYAILPVNPARHPHVKIEAVKRLEEWLAGPRGKAVIEGFTADGAPLFIHSAVPRSSIN